MTECLNCGHKAELEFRYCPACGTEVAPTAADALIGKTLNGKYRVVAEIGEGSMGRVYRAEHVSLKKPIAIKVLRHDLTVSDESLKRFQGEGIAAGKFSHPNAIQIFDFDQDDAGHWFLAMEYVEGRSLKSLLAEKGPLGAELATDVMLQVLAALCEAHRQGIVHRDLKPDNIMVVGTSTGELQVKVLDFGLSKLRDRPSGSTLMTQTGRILGTPRYMAPEQWHGQEVDHRLDLYAAGLILYELIAGEPPFGGSTIQETLLRSTTDPVPSLVDSHPELRIPTGLDDVIAKALEKDKAERYQSAEEMIAAIEALDFDLIATPTKSTSGMRAKRSRRRHAARQPRAEQPSRAPLIMGGAAVLIVGAAVWFFFLRDSGTSFAGPRLSMKPIDARTQEEAAYVRTLERARQQIRAGKLREALATVDGALQMPCRDSEAYLVRAHCYRQRNHPEMAIADLREALKLDPGYADAEAGIGWVHVERNDLDSALEHFRAAEKIDSSCALAIAGQGSVQLLRGEVEQALTLLEAAAGIAPTSAVAQQWLGHARLAKDDAEGAREAFIEAIRNDSSAWRAYVGLGDAYLRQGRLKEAEEQLTEAITINPAAAGARTELATLLLNNQRYRDAIGVLDEALRSDPEQGRMQILKGIALQGTGDMAGAREALEKGVRLEPDDARAQTLLGMLYYQEGRFEEAVDRHEAALRVDANLFLPYLNQGLALVKLGRYEDAARKLRDAILLDDSSAFAHMTLGVLAMDYLGKPDEALAAFRRYKQVGGKDPKVDDWIQQLSRQ